jgi:hypothetical protein
MKICHLVATELQVCCEEGYPRAVVFNEFLKLSALTCSQRPREEGVSDDRKVWDRSGDEDYFLQVRVKATEL